MVGRTSHGTKWKKKSTKKCHALNTFTVTEFTEPEIKTESCKTKVNKKAKECKQKHSKLGRKPKARAGIKITTSGKKDMPKKKVMRNKHLVKINNEYDYSLNMHLIKRGGAVFILHFPHGFYEEEMKKYFSQFGTVLKVVIGRSEKSGARRGFAYVFFQDAEVAQVAAKTMDSYLMFNKILKCKYIPGSEISYNMFKWDNMNRCNCPGTILKMKQYYELSHRRTRKECKLQREKIIARFTAKVKKLKALGVDLNLRDVAGLNKV